MGRPMLVIEDVTRVHGAGETEVRALDGVSLTVSTGELVADMGPSRSGKSTLAQPRRWLDRATSGSVTVAGTELGTLGAHDRGPARHEVHTRPRASPAAYGLLVHRPSHHLRDHARVTPPSP